MSGALTFNQNLKLSRRRWEITCPSLRVIRAADKAIIYRQGERCANTYLITRGHLKLARITAHGDARIIAILPAGEFCGARLIRDAPQHALDTASAMGDVELYRIPVGEIVNAISHDGELASYIIQNMFEQQSSLECRIEHLLNRDVHGRLAAILIELAGRYGKHCPHGHEIDIRLTQQELAEYVGASRPVVSTTLNRLRDQGIVSYTRRYICIESLQLLERVALSSMAVN